jgi:hypothetical protein
MSLEQYLGIRYLPTGGTNGQVLTKQSSIDFDAIWQTPGGGGGGLSWTTIYDDTPTVTPQIVIDVTTYSIIRWSVTDIRHNDAVTNRTIYIYFSADNGASYTLPVGSATAFSSTTDAVGSGFIFKTTYNYFATGVPRARGVLSAYSNVGGTAGSPQPTTFAFKPSGGASFQAVGNIKVEGLI